MNRPGSAIDTQAAQSGSPSLKCKALLVLGMHRSGTSLVARIANLCGVAIDDAHLLMRASGHNERGYWEPRYLAEINDSLLAAGGGSWCDPPLEAFEGTAVAPKTHARMKDRVDRWRAMGRSWVWKDPRMTLLLGAWLPVVGDAAALICLRNPHDVWLSLYRRDRFPRASSYLLWEVYTRAALRDSANLPRLIVDYDRLIADAAKGVARIATFLTAERLLDKAPESLEAATAECVGDLRHHGHAAERFLNDPVATESQKRLYKAMVECDPSQPPKVNWPISTPADEVLSELSGLQERYEVAERSALNSERFNVLDDKLGRVNGSVEHLHRICTALRDEIGRLANRLDYIESKVGGLLISAERMERGSGNTQKSGRNRGDVHGDCNR